MNASSASHPDREHALTILHQMLLIRRFEEKSAELYSLGKIRGFLHLYIGEEAVAVGAIPALSRDDSLVSTYREHGHALIRGMPAGAVMAEMFGKVNGCSRGRGGSMHLFDVSRRFFGGNAIVAGGLPLAVGLALADKLQGRQRVTACLFGDGAVAEGAFHESLNLAALWQLPVLFLCENNLYAMGTRIERYQSRPEIYPKAAGYGISADCVDGMDVLAVQQTAAAAVDFVRSNSRPFLLEAKTYRFRAHSMYDAELYRSKSEVEEWKQRDPINAFLAQARTKRLVNDDDIKSIDSRVATEVAEAVAFAEAGEWEPIQDVTKDVYTRFDGPTNASTVAAQTHPQVPV
ncbi:MAG TPA: pyruvate dehydrogenase (acetyl-transferring) E1 component subunit alpha [Planctomycetaceae bacterium]|nr:pyruvate dehydrogenase (acetyl-transferring) E1 component subunit alpha [Planctomycetaceae bacterium]